MGFIGFCLWVMIDVGWIFYLFELYLCVEVRYWIIRRELFFEIGIFKVLEYWVFGNYFWEWRCSLWKVFELGLDEGCVLWGFVFMERNVFCFIW